MSNEITLSLLGKVIAEQDIEKARRDCVHIAVFPAMVAADTNVGGGYFVRLQPGTSDEITDCDPDDADCIGIVDPFIVQYPVTRGQRVFVFLKPGTITGLTHRWSHPIIDAAIEQEEERQLGLSVPDPTQMRHDPVTGVIGPYLNLHEQWLRDFAARWNFDYDDLIASANTVARGERSGFGDYVVARGRSLHSAEELGEDYELFWHHFEGLTDRRVHRDDRNALRWTCSC